MKRCECCGQVIPPDIQFTPTKQRIWEAIKERPRTPEQVRLVVWGHDPNGGPDNPNTLHVHVAAMNKILRQYGVQIKGRWGNPYRLVAA